MSATGQDDLFLPRTSRLSRVIKRLRSHTPTRPPKDLRRFLGTTAGPTAGRDDSREVVAGILEEREAEEEEPRDESGDFEEEWEKRREKLVRITLAGDSMQTLFQPIVDLRTGGTVGAEALARFTAPPFRPPDLWFAEAAEVGLGTELEVSALRSALHQLAQLPSGLYLSLNASPATIVSPEFRAAMAEIPAERVVLELTEHTGIDDYYLFGEAIAEMRSNGLRLAVDDAGAGFSSFRHILNLRPDIIKLDIALTRGIDRDPARRALGSAMLAFGLDAYNASIVAEGIETHSEMTTLQALGCKYGQGYYLGRPAQLSVLPRAVSQPGGHRLMPQRRAPLTHTIPLNPEMPADMAEIRARIGTIRSR